MLLLFPVYIFIHCCKILNPTDNFPLLVDGTPWDIHALMRNFWGFKPPFQQLRFRIAFG